MTAPPLTFVREPSRVVPSRGAPASEDATAAFAAALADAAGRAVALFEGLVRDAPADGILVVRPTADFATIRAELDPARAAELPARTVLIGDRRSDLLRTLERYELAGGIDEDRWFRWRTRGAADIGAGICGLKSVAAAMADAEVLDDTIWETDGYGLIVSEALDGPARRARGLPRGLRARARELKAAPRRQRGVRA